MYRQSLRSLVQTDSCDFLAFLTLDLLCLVNMALHKSILILLSLHLAVMVSASPNFSPEAPVKKITSSRRQFEALNTSAEAFPLDDVPDEDFLLYFTGQTGSGRQLLSVQPSIISTIFPYGGATFNLSVSLCARRLRQSVGRFCDLARKASRCGF